MHFKCKTINHCILTSYICDGQHDCYDKSHENSCSNNTPFCSDMYYPGSSSECLIVLNGMYRDRLTIYYVNACYL